MAGSVSEVYAQPIKHDEVLPEKVSGGERRIQAAQVRALCADISDMTLWRWINERDFPKPIYIGRRRYWRESDVSRWLDDQAVQAPCSIIPKQRSK